VRFELSEEAMALREAAAGLLASEVTPAVIRAGWPGGDPGQVAAAWRKLAAAGAAGTLVPEARGGLGLDETSLVPLLEEIGRSGLPVPAAETIGVAAPLLAGDGLAGDRLAGVLAGDTLAAAQLGDGDLVPHAQHARLIVLREGSTLRAYEAGELALEPCATIDGSRGLARLAQRPAGGGTLLTEDPAQAEAAWQRGVLGTSALLTGLARRMLDLTVSYVSRREQFGVPVGSFQAIKHALASALVAVEFARPMVLAAAWAQAARTAEAAAQTSAAKVLASNAARLVARTAIQCHGAIGYTTEYDLHLYAKRAWALASAWGDPAWHRARLATFLVLPRGDTAPPGDTPDPDGPEPARLGVADG
jgi:alkylation response protein AidB-like acyl-CoA dehydrogenase